MTFPGKNYLRNYLTRRFQVPEIPVALSFLKQRGFEPHRIFDVGAYRGDFARECIELWPFASIHCFEPQPHMQKCLHGLSASNPNIVIHQFVLGAEPRASIDLYCAETASSVLKEHHSAHPSLQCEQMTIDQVICDSKVSPPNFIKVDVQGYELEVLRGGQTTLPSVDAILLELNLLDLHREVPLIAEVMQWLSERNFVAYELAGLTRRPLDRALWQIDMVFVKKDSWLRSDKRWSASETDGQQPR